MTTREALIDAIIREQDEDTPRLLFADWLDEFGDTETDRQRAEFIRVSVEIYRLAHDRHKRKKMTPNEIAERWEELGTRELELAEQLYSHAIAPDMMIATIYSGGATNHERMEFAGELDNKRSVTISRGFAVRLTLDRADWRLAWYFAREPVRAIKILGNGVGTTVAHASLTRGIHWRATDRQVHWFNEFGTEFGDGRIPWDVFEAGMNIVDGGKYTPNPQAYWTDENGVRWRAREFNTVQQAREWLSRALIAWSRSQSVNPPGLGW